MFEVIISLPSCLYNRLTKGESVYSWEHWQTVTFFPLFLGYRPVAGLWQTCFHWPLKLYEVRYSYQHTKRTKIDQIIHSNSIFIVTPWHGLCHLLHLFSVKNKHEYWLVSLFYSYMGLDISFIWNILVWLLYLTNFAHSNVNILTLFEDIWRYNQAEISFQNELIAFQWNSPVTSILRT